MLKNNIGRIEVITGPMFSGKSDELIKRIKRYRFAKTEVLVVKPNIDTRWEKDKIISRTGAYVKTKVVKNSKEIWKHWDPKYKVVAIDEAQFFDEGIVEVILQLVSKDVRVIVSALDQDFEGQPFRFVPKLLAIAEKVDKLTAVCLGCGAEASMSFRVTDSKNQVEVGDAAYEARCRKCHISGMKEKEKKNK